MCKRKVCNKCGEEKTLNMFYGNKSRPDGFQSWCKACDSERLKRYYQNNKAKWKTTYKESRVRYRQVNRERMLDYLKRSFCVDCGEKDIRVLEFDHVRGDKIANVSRLLADRSWAVVEAEMAKCDLICANCHRKRTYARSKCYRVLEETLT